MLKMKNSKEYKISIVMSSIALVLFAISIVTGLIPGLNYSIDDISKNLGFAFFCLGLVFLIKSQNANENTQL